MSDSPRRKPSTLKADAPVQVEQRSLLRDALRRFLQNRLAMLGAIVLGILLVIAVFADLVAPYGLNQVDFSIVRMRPFEDSDHILGGDGVGRDFLTRLIYGARTSLFVGLLVPLISFGFAVPLGAIAGYRGGTWDFVILRIVEIATAIPPLLFAMFLISITGAGLGNVIFVLAVTSWIEPARIARAQFLKFRETEFVLAARALGGIRVSDHLASYLAQFPNAALGIFHLCSASGNLCRSRSQLFGYRHH